MTTLMTRQETVKYHSKELKRLEAEGCTDEMLLQYHRDGTEIFDYVEFDGEKAKSLANLIANMTGKPAPSIDELRAQHEAFYANEMEMKKAQ